MEKTPSHVVVDCNGVGYLVHVSLHTYSKIPDSEFCKLLTLYNVSVDVRSGHSTHTLYGFAENDERELFKLLVSVSGVSVNTARMILSSLSPEEVVNAIASEDVASVKQVKGIGPKLAQKIINELKDKVSDTGTTSNFLPPTGNTNKQEALSALLALGFDRSSSAKVLDKVIKNQGDNAVVEELIKQALKQL